MAPGRLVSIFRLTSVGCARLIDSDYACKDNAFPLDLALAACDDSVSHVPGLCWMDQSDCAIQGLCIPIGIGSRGVS